MITESMIEVVGLRKSFGALEVLRNISLSVPPGGVVALIGPSGSGKSTLLRCLNLLVTPDEGRIRIGDRVTTFDGRHTQLPRDRELAAYRANAGMVFQHFNLFPHMTVLGNVIEGPRTVQRKGLAEAERLAQALLVKVGLADKAAEFPSRLSGGQKQRVAIARALAMQPSVMLLDEVTSALDPELVGEVLAVIQSLAEEDMTMVIATHDISFARKVADRVVFMRGGLVVEEGSSAEVIDAPREPQTRAFLAHFHGSAR